MYLCELIINATHNFQYQSFFSQLQLHIKIVWQSEYIYRSSSTGRWTAKRQTNKSHKYVLFMLENVKNVLKMIFYFSKIIDWPKRKDKKRNPLVGCFIVSTKFVQIKLIIKIKKWEFNFCSYFHKTEQNSVFILSIVIQIMVANI